MAEEGGYDPDDTNPFDPHGGDDGDGEKIPLIPIPKEKHHPPGTSTPIQHTSTSAHYNPSFVDETPSGVIQRREETQDRAVEMINEVFPNADTRKFFVKIEDGIVYTKIKKGIRNILHKTLDEYGNVLIDERKGKFPKMLRDALGKSALEIATEKIAENTEENDKDQGRIKDLDHQINNTAVGGERDKLVEEQNIVQERINVRNQENEAIEERLTLRQRIKAIFRKYGFTAFAVATAIGTVIGVIVSNLKAGLTKVAKGVGNGLKELGKKLGEILPGMVGAIASFIFRTAGEVIGFLAKNAWLLIVGLVLFAVEHFKNKKK